MTAINAAPVQRPDAESSGQMAWKTAEADDCLSILLNIRIDVADQIIVSYDEKLEMLYYFIEPILSDSMSKVILKKYTTMDELVDEIRRSYNV
ncbi:hypothetical protein GCM10007905_35510 [Mixta theicola]|nr:hypothetical protein GCM10007905_35510 [Mixta theicola]